MGTEPRRGHPRQAVVLEGGQGLLLLAGGVEVARVGTGDLAGASPADVSLRLGSNDSLER